ncbi:MAG: OmpH family outer membrane protein [Flavobacteriales bacterium]|nr:OmpH family outer membrane protein [Flavobacteriales bacterium]
MKNILFTSFLLLALTWTATAQKFGYVDTQYILLHVPGYYDAQVELNGYAADWQEEIEDKYGSIQRLEEAFAAEKILLTEEMKKKRESEIQNLRQQALQMQKQKFGVEGELFNKREELIKPIQDEIYEAIKEVASSRGYMVIFDKANQNNMLYTNPKYDVSDQVIKKMGYKPGETIEDPNAEKDQKGNLDKSTKSSPGADRNGGNARGNTVPAKGGKR